MSQYPVVLIPHSIARTQNALPPTQPLPLVASFNKPAPIKPGSPPQPLETGILVMEGIGLLVVVAGALSASAVLGVLLLLVGAGLIAYQGFRQYHSFPERLHGHEQKVKGYEIQHQNHLKQKRAFEEKEQRKQEQARQAQERQRSEPYLTEYRRKLLEDALKQTILHDGDNSNAQEGQLERKFNGYLNRYFDGYIYKGLTLNIPNYDYPYTPDFVYRDTKFNLHIDIEIDEPYVYRTGKPTHYDDSRRNQFFLDKGWLVIRFAEEQVCLQPKSCCKVVAETIHQLTNQTIDSRLSQAPDLKPIQQWSEAEALSMAERQYRNSYLDRCC